MIDSNAPFVLRLHQYLMERLPVLPTLFSATLIAGAADAVGQVLRAGHDGGVIVDATSVTGIATLFAFMFVLRVCDEHKDFAVDRAAQPDRSVSRGLITLRELAASAAVLVAAALLVGR